MRAADDCTGRKLLIAPDSLALVGIGKAGVEFFSWGCGVSMGMRGQAGLTPACLEADAMGNQLTANP